MICVVLCFEKFRRCYRDYPRFYQCAEGSTPSLTEGHRPRNTRQGISPSHPRSDSSREKTASRSWYSLGSFVAGSVYTLGARALSMSAIDTAKISWSGFFAMRMKGAAPMQQIFGSASNGLVSVSGSDSGSGSGSGSGSRSCRYILGKSWLCRCRISIVGFGDRVRDRDSRGQCPLCRTVADSSGVKFERAKQRVRHRTALNCSRSLS